MNIKEKNKLQVRKIMKHKDTKIYPMADTLFMLNFQFIIIFYKETTI